jgi:hypothetical protein
MALIIPLHLAPVLKNEGWENGIKMDLQEVGWGETDWIYLAYDRNRWQALVDAVINFHGP